MQRANRTGVPFWPAPSIVDTPVILFDWQDAAAQGEAQGHAERQRIQAKRAALAAAQPPTVRRIS